MAGMDKQDVLFVVWAFLFQIALIVHFALRKWAFGVVESYGWITYALGIPAAIVSVILLSGGKDWSLWLGGFLCLAWAILGFTVEYALGITDWRGPVVRWEILIPYVGLYLATLMFYWWPLANIGRPLWFVATVLFIVGTVLNIASH